MFPYCSTVSAPSRRKLGRVDDWRGGGRTWGVAVSGGFRDAGASVHAMAPFPVAALRTRRAVFRHRALQWDHASRTRTTGSIRACRRSTAPICAQAAQLPPCIPSRARRAAEPVHASTTSNFSGSTSSLMHVMVPESLPCTRGPGIATPASFLPSHIAPHLRPLSLDRHYPASSVVRASPPPRPARPVPRGVPVGACHATDGASRVASLSRVHACHRHYPGRTAGCACRSSSPATPAFPESQAGRLLHHAFRGLLNVHCSLPPACSPSPFRTLYTGSFSRFVTSTTVPIATGWNDSCRVGVSPTERTRLARRTEISALVLPSPQEPLPVGEGRWLLPREMDLPSAGSASGAHAGGTPSSSEATPPQGGVFRFGRLPIAAGETTRGRDDSPRRAAPRGSRSPPPADRRRIAQESAGEAARRAVAISFHSSSRDASEAGRPARRYQYPALGRSPSTRCR